VNGELDFAFFVPHNPADLPTFPHAVGGPADPLVPPAAQPARAFAPMTPSPARPPLEETPGDIALARLNVKSLGEAEVEPLRTQLLHLLERRRGQDLLLDLGEVEYLTSTGLGLFIDLHRRVREGGGRLSLVNVGEPVYELFSLTHLDTLLDVRREGPEGTPA
jgi:anti-sigma B factor antagonist